MICAQVLKQKKKSDHAQLLKNVETAMYQD